MKGLHHLAASASSNPETLGTLRAEFGLKKGLGGAHYYTDAREALLKAIIE